MGKHLKYILASLLLIIVSSCKQEKLKSTCTVVIVDKTSSNYDHHFNYPSTEIIDEFFENTNPKDERTFWLTEISDVSMNTIEKHELHVQNYWENPHNRVDSVKTFYAKVDKSLSNIFSTIGEKTESSIYLSLCHLINLLNETNADVKKILMFSDLIENSSLSTSFYHTPPTQENYSKLIQLLETKDSIGDLSGIEIVVVYKPTTRQSDKLFYSAKSFWTELVESKGGKIRYVANLN